MPGTTVQGTRAQYEVLATVGRGGMGVVYRARRLSDGTTVALKEMRPADVAKSEDRDENRRLFTQEAELLLRLSHPNIVTAYETFEWDGRPYVVMEFVAGVTLEKKLRDANAPQFEQDVVAWGVQMARVLDYLHTQKPPIIYRDLKPANVILTPSGAIKFIDFGVARTFKERKAKDTVAIGTYGYAPPEQYGKGQTDARSDVYTLGATLYHMLTNLGPIPLRTPEVGSIQQVNPSVRSQTEQVIIKAMQQDRDLRWRSAGEMEQALAACLQQPLPVATPAPDATQRTVTPVVPPRAQRQLQVPGATRAPELGPTKQITDALVGIAEQPTFCPACGRGNRPTARFCATCGASLPAPAPAAKPTSPPPLILPTPSLQPAGRFHITTSRGSWDFPLQTVPCRIGRRDPSQNHYPELDLADYDRGHASRRHAVIERRGAQFVLTDVGSINGTILNGKRISPHHAYPLQAGDIITIGDVKMQFEWS
ncbi:MAG: protein kinase [Herpetosiphonaceae bacterium]|nr:protein kinase [Herpetosiphonaceae bacterium]